jgi:alginate O-acetyltransferase complex protein AlgI
VTAYAFQICFDFSGYSDMAIGLGLMLGFVFPKNVDSPCLSQ